MRYDKEGLNLSGKLQDGWKRGFLELDAVLCSKHFGQVQVEAAPGCAIRVLSDAEKAAKNARVDKWGMQLHDLFAADAKGLSGVFTRGDRDLSPAFALSLRKKYAHRGLW